MRHIVYSVAFLLLLCTFPTVRAGEIHFLPEPQQVKLSGEQFDMKRVRLVSSVLVPQLEAWVTEAGGTADECASSVIEIRLVEKLEGIPLNENEGAWQRLCEPSERVADLGQQRRRLCQRAQRLL